MVIYQDRHAFVLNKPPGLATQGGTKTTQHLDRLLDGLADDDAGRPKLVHRLDKDTSGALLVAKTARAAGHFSKSFSGRTARKVYWALVVGLLATAIGGALRGLFPSIGWLYAMTIASAAGVAVMQVTMPSAVRAWVPDRIAFATAVYTNGLLIGETLPVALTIPFVLPLVGSWQWGFVFWSVPVVVIALVIGVLAPPPAPIAGAPVRRRWWPDWRNLLIWRLGVMLGTVNAVYFATNAFIPDYLRAHGQGEWISAALTGLNAGQLPASALLLMFARQLQLKAWPIMAVGALCIVATAGIVFGSGPVVVAAASLQGFAAASILILVLALPPLLSPPDDVHRVTAAMFTISYTCAVIIPIISGALWDITGVAALAFAPIAISGLLLIVLASAVSHVQPVEV